MRTHWSVENLPLASTSSSTRNGFHHWRKDKLPQNLAVSAEWPSTSLKPIPAKEIPAPAVKLALAQKTSSSNSLLAFDNPYYKRGRVR